MPLYRRKGESVDVSVKGSSLLVVRLEREPVEGWSRWFRRRKQEKTEKTDFDTNLEARLEFARVTRELRDKGFVCVEPVNAKRLEDDPIAAQTRAKFVGYLELSPGETIEADAAARALSGLIELRKAIEAATRGEFFTNHPDLLDGLDPEPLIARWEAAIQKTYGGPLTVIELQSRSHLEQTFALGEPPEAIGAIEYYTAERALRSLFELRGTCQRSAAGQYFSNAPHLVDGLDPQPRIDRWKQLLSDELGELGRVFFAEIGAPYGVPDDGLTLRTNRHRGTFKPLPLPRSGRGFDRAGEDDEVLLGLEEELLRNRTSPDLYAVYADRLQELGNVVGELIALGIAADADATNEPAFRRFLEANKVEVLDRLGEIDQAGIDLSWRCGFVSAARFGDAGNDAIMEGIEALLDCKAGALLTELTVGMLGDYELDYEPVISLLAEKPRPALQTLFLGDFDYPEDIEMSWVIVGDVSPLWEALPDLRELTLQGGELELGAIHAPSLRRLSIRTGALSRSVLRSISRAKLAQLEELEVWLGDPAYGATCTVEDIRPLLSAQALPGLKVLRLMNAAFSDDIAEALGRADIVGQLETIDLSMGTLGQQGARALLTHIERFAHLSRLDLSDSCLDDESCAQLGRHSFVVLDSQKGSDEDSRYVSVGE